MNFTCNATRPQLQTLRWSSPELLEGDGTQLVFHLFDKVGRIKTRDNSFATAKLTFIDNTTSQLISILMVKIPNSVNFTQFTVTCDGQSKIYFLIGKYQMTLIFSSSS